MIHEGKVVLCAPLDEIKASHHRLTLRFPETQPAAPALPGALACEGAGREWTTLCDGRLDEIKTAAAALNAAIVEEGVPSLEEIFVARVGTRGAGMPHAAQREA